LVVPLDELRLPEVVDRAMVLFASKLLELSFNVNVRVAELPLWTVKLEEEMEIVVDAVVVDVVDPAS
jgi:hypothetical protein